MEKLQQVLKILKGKTIGLLGLTFKPNTDDMRDAPSLDLIANLTRLGAKVKAYDPIISEKDLHSSFANINLTNNPLEVARDCDALVLVTDWQIFSAIDYQKIAKLMITPIIIDGRNFLNPQTLEQAGFYYVGIGRPSTGDIGIATKIFSKTVSKLEDLQPI